MVVEELTWPRVAWAILLGGLACLFALPIWLLVAVPEERPAILPLFGVVLLVDLPVLGLFALFSRLRVTLDPDALTVGFGPFRQRLPLARIAACDPATYRWIEYGGYGIRSKFWLRTTLYNVPGDGRRVVRVTLDDGRRVLFSARDPAAVCALLVPHCPQRRRDAPAARRPELKRRLRANPAWWPVAARASAVPCRRSSRAVDLGAVRLNAHSGCEVRYADPGAALPDPPEPGLRARDADTVAAPLTGHARTMAQGVYRVAERFYVAVGYGNANMAMVVGTDGVILIDSLENAEAAREALADLRRFSGRPIRALIYTHGHPAHKSGSRGLLDPSEVERGQVAIYAHERLFAGMRGNPSLGLVAPARLAYSFDWGLDPGAEGLVEVGPGPLLRSGTTGFLPPTAVFRGSLDIEVAGIRVHLREAPSEADDEVVLWFPDHGVLHAADVIQGACLPNLYALRGAVRDIGQWIGAVDLLRGRGAGALLVGHGRPLVGQDEVGELLTAYRDAMRYIHDQALRLMARGLTPDELVEAVAALPPRLRDHPWLGEFYGTVKQIVRQVYHTAFGWFERAPTFLDPLPRRERAARYLAAMGGATRSSSPPSGSRWSAIFAGRRRS